MTNPLEIAAQFAQALDAEDYRAAAALLADECEYLCRGQLHCGPAAIVAAYRAAGDAAARDFEQVEYESAVSAIAENAARIRFVDHLQRHNERFTFQCEQVVTVGDDGRIKRIEHVDLPGQREGLAAFVKQPGVTKASANSNSNESAR